ncbi:MAG: hypothetical protein ACXWWQ_01625 [Candidatus Limnocylindria bacterium]
MRHLQLGVGHRPPDRLAIVAAHVACPLTRRSQPMLRCSSCPHFEGMLVGPDLCVLCAAPARRAVWRTPRRRRTGLIFDQDWPDD